MLAVGPSTRLLCFECCDRDEGERSRASTPANANDKATAAMTFKAATFACRARMRCAAVPVWRPEAATVYPMRPIDRVTLDEAVHIVGCLTASKTTCLSR